MTHKAVLILVAFSCLQSLREECDAQILMGSADLCTMDNGCVSCCDPFSSGSCDCSAYDCYCDQACLSFNDCCKDIYQLDTCGSFGTELECTSGSVRLVGGPDPSKGILEICIFRSWEPVCVPSFTDVVYVADVACNSLNYSVAEGQEIYISSINGIKAYSAVCQGNEPRLTECLVDYQFYNFHPAYQVYVKCSGLCDPKCVNGTCNASNECQCNEGWEGEACDQDINECTDSTTCGLLQCRNTPGSRDCYCDEGFVISRINSDSDCENLLDLDLLDLCTNGSRFCLCPDGFEQTINDTCEDIDECINNDTLCDHGCNNTDGSYVCYCREGFTLETDNRMCKGTSTSSDRSFTPTPLPANAVGTSTSSDRSFTPTPLPTNAVGSCVQGGYWGCCVPSFGGVCFVNSSTSTCFCDEICHRLGDCCTDILEIQCFGLSPSSSTMVTSSARSTLTFSSSVPLTPTDSTISTPSTSSSMATVITNKPSSLSTTVQITILLASLLVTVLVVLVFVAVWLLLKRKYTSNRVAKEMKNVNMEMHFLQYKGNNYDAGTVFSNISLKKSQSKLLPTHLRELSDSMIGSESVKLLELIGQGEFGIVYRGLLIQADAMPMAVAVKTLKGQFREIDIERILEESLRMKKFDHLNVLPLIGVSLDLSDAPCIIMPYMSEGSLLSYLKRERPRLSVAENATLNDDAINNITKQLLSICLQVANGMVYLSIQKFVHRDLAARNCLMSTDGVIKIADFGLAEDVYTNNYFRHDPHVSDQVKMPIKWMALESIHDQLFNEKSDVWSYGILCWEVFSLGKTPYPGLRPGELVEFLDSGERLHQPKNAACSDEIFSLFVSCWNKVPDQRPSFEDIASSVNELLMPFAVYMEFTDFFGTQSITD